MKLNMRTAYGQALLELGADKRVVALEADLGKSTMSNMFGAKYPERYFQMGIAEANMASVAAGLALTGHIAYMSSFAAFASGRCYDQIRSSVCIPNLNVKICGSSAGLSDYGDGKTHQSIDDIAIMRVLPHMKVFSPADAYETAKIVKSAAEMDGPCYIRVNRNDVPVVTGEDDIWDMNAKLLRDGADAVIYATGYMVSLSLDAAELLEKDGVSARVVNISTIKPLDIEGVRGFAEGMRAAVTVEEASIYGGLGSAVCEALIGGKNRVPTLNVGIRDTFGTSANDYDELLGAYKLTSADIAAQVVAALNI